MISLIEAEKACAEAADALETAKQTYFNCRGAGDDTAKPEEVEEAEHARLAVRQAEAELADARLALERVQYHQRLAREAQTAAERGEAELELEQLEATDARRLDAVQAAIRELVELEAKAYAAVQLIEQTSRERLLDFERRKSLSPQLDREKPAQRPSDADYARYAVRAAIRARHMDAGLLGSKTNPAAWILVGERTLYFGPAPTAPELPGVL